MHHRGVTTGMMVRRRIAAGHRQQSRNECAPHLANQGTAQGRGTAVLAAVVHGRRITDKLRLRTLEMQVMQRLASLARASKIIVGFIPRCVPVVDVGAFGGRAVLRSAWQVSVLDRLGHRPVTARVRLSGWVDA
jgi:hypothetical protein